MQEFIFALNVVDLGYWGKTTHHNVIEENFDRFFNQFIASYNITDTVIESNVFLISERI